MHIRMPSADQTGTDIMGPSIQRKPRRTAQLHCQYLASDVRRNDVVCYHRRIKDTVHIQRKSKLIKDLIILLYRGTEKRVFLSHFLLFYYFLGLYHNFLKSQGTTLPVFFLKNQV